MKIHAYLAFIALAGLMASAAAGQNPPAAKAPQAPPPLEIQRIRGDLYLVKGGSGANTAFYVTDKEVFVIDAKMSSASAAGMLAEIKKVTPAPVTTVVITHSDGDHINGLPGFPKGLTIVAHETCKADMVTAAEAQPELKDYIPNKAYGDRLELLSGPAPIILAYFGPAHTSGDSVVYFPAEKAVFVGDLLFVGRDPLIHRHKNGNSFGFVKTLEALLALTPAVEVFLSGHADPLGRADVEAVRTSLADKQAKVKAMIDDGRTLEEIKKAFGVVDRPAGPGGRRFLSLIETIYLELTEKT